MALTPSIPSRLLYHRIEGKAYLPLQVWCPSTFSELHRGRHLFPCASNFKFAALLNEWTINCLFSLTDATHSLTSTLLTNEFSLLGQSNARTQSITRGQSFISLSLPNVCHRSGTISPLFTCSLLSSLRSGRLRHVQLSWTGDFGFWHFHSS